MNIPLFTQVKSTLICIARHLVSGDILPDSNLKEDLGLTKTMIVNFLLALEKNIDEFEINPETLTVSDLYTVGSLCHYIEKELGQKNHNKDAYGKTTDTPPL